MLYRQGDILIRRIDKIPLRRRRVDEGETQRIVLAYGEITGHAHVIEARPDEARIRHGVVEREERTFLEVLAPSVRLEHDEHAVIEIPAGEYEIVRQREYTGERPQRVAD
jgi:hypothetical protein